MPALHWPMPFHLLPSDRTLLATADKVFAYRVALGGTPTEVLELLFDVTHGLNPPGFLRGVWLTPPGRLADAHYDEHFTFQSMRLRVVEYVPGERIAVAVERCTWPLGRRMVQVADVTSRPDGGTDLHWRIGVELVPWTRPLAPLVFPTFEPLFRGTIEALRRRLGDAASTAA